MVAPAVRQTLRALRYATASFLAAVALYGLVREGDWIGPLFLGLVAWVVWPKNALDGRKAARTPIGQPEPVRSTSTVATEPRGVPTAVAFGVLGTVLVVALVGALVSGTSESDPPEPNLDAYIADVRPHLAVTGWTDIQLFDWGTGVCSELDRTDGNVRALFPEMIRQWKDAGYTDADLPMVQNDSAFIISAAIHQLCPEWIDSYREYFPPSPTP